MCGKGGEGEDEKRKGKQRESDEEIQQEAACVQSEGERHESTSKAKLPKLKKAIFS